MSVVWSFPPTGKVTEILGWRTDVIQAKSQEQRIGLRKLPRRSWELEHQVLPEQVKYIKDVYLSDKDFIVPDWVSPLGRFQVAAGTHVVVPLPGTANAIEVGDYIVLWSGLSLHEACVVEASDGVSITLASVTAAQTALLLRGDECIPTKEVSISRAAYGKSKVTTSFSSKGNAPATAVGSYNMLADLDIFPWFSVVASGALDEDIEWPLMTLDGEVGRQESWYERTYSSDVVKVSFLESTPAGILDVRKWLFSKKGKLIPFWLSSWSNDFVAASTLGSSGTILTVFADFMQLSGFPEIQALEIVGNSTYHREVVSVTAGSPVGGRPTYYIELSSSLGTAHDPEDFIRISVMKKRRFDTDRFELNYSEGGKMRLNARCVAVP